MIPNQKAALQNISQLLKTGGLVAIADFFMYGNFDHICHSNVQKQYRALESSLHKWWFSMDHVHLLHEEPLELGGSSLRKVWDNRFRGPVPFMPFFQPYHGVHIREKVASQ